MLEFKSNVLGDAFKGTEEFAVPEILTGVETLAGYKRNGKDVYQKEIDFGALPNNTTKSVAHGVVSFDWASIDQRASYVKDGSDYYPTAYGYEPILQYFFVTPSYIIGKTFTNKSTMTAKIVINYTKP